MPAKINDNKVFTFLPLPHSREICVTKNYIKHNKYKSSNVIAMLITNNFGYVRISQPLCNTIISFIDVHHLQIIYLSKQIIMDGEFGGESITVTMDGEYVCLDYPKPYCKPSV